MNQEIEQTYRVHTASMPQLEDVPYTDIEQIYYTPYPVNALYPETASGELRVRQKQQGGQVQYIAAAKFGDKASGSRTEIETILEPGAFGTTPEDQELFAYGRIKKRRYHASDEIVIDRFDPQLHGDLWLAEREFASLEEAAVWQAPEWCEPLDPAPSNRTLAVPLSPTQESLHTHRLEQAVEEIRALSQSGKLLVTISGMSGSGKSTVAKQITTELNTAYIESDNFHIGAKALLDRDGAINHDLPSAYAYDEVALAALKLFNHEVAHLPQYDFASAERLAEPVTVEPSNNQLVVAEGLYAKHASEHVAQYDPEIQTYDILVGTPLYVCVLRRLMRDAIKTEAVATERDVAWTAEEVLRYMFSVVIPTYREYAHSPEQFDAVI